LYHETTETLGTVETLFTPKIALKVPEKAIIRSEKPPKNTCFSLFSTQKHLKNTLFSQKIAQKSIVFQQKTNKKASKMRLFVPL